jgi:hypothetical protein
MYFSPIFLITFRFAGKKKKDGFFGKTYFVPQGLTIPLHFFIEE